MIMTLVFGTTSIQNNYNYYIVLSIVICVSIGPVLKFSHDCFLHTEKHDISNKMP